MEMILIILFSFILLVFYLSNRKTKRTNEIEKMEQLERLLLTKITSLKDEINELEATRNSISIDKATKLTKQVIQILDVYEQSNIRIPIDILDDLQLINLYNENEVYNFIENQRNYWKLENTKKVFRR